MTAAKKFDIQNYVNPDTFWNEVGNYYPQSTFEINSNFEIVQFNPSFKSMLGASDDNLVNKSWSNYIRNQDIAKFENLIKYVLDHLVPRTARILFVHNKGEIVWSNCQFIPALNSKGEFSVLIFVTDQSHQHHLHEKLNLLSAQVEHINLENYVGAFQYIPETKQSIFDEFWITMSLGYNISDLRIKNDGLKTILPADSYNEFFLWLNSVKTKNTPNLKVYFLNAEGKKMATLCGGKKVISAGSETIHIWCKDISTNENLKNRIKEFEISDMQSDRLAFIGEMTSEISHELGNNIMSMSLALELLDMKRARSTIKVEDYERALTVVCKSVNRMQNVITGVKHLSYNADGEKFVEMDLSDLIDEIEMIFTNVINKEGFKFSVETEFVKSKKIYCESTYLLHGLINLIKNSADAIENEKVQWIKIVIMECDKYFKFKVIDSGSGISDELREKIFKQYFTTKGKGKGTGLGLSVAQKVADMHKGKFYLDESCENTSFVIQIPKK